MDAAGWLEAAAARHMPALLTLYWALAAGSVVVTLTPLPVPQAFKDAVRLSAARGKLWQGKPAALGPLRDWAVPQAWFLHFYVAGAAANAAALAAFALSAAGGSGQTSSSSSSGSGSGSSSGWTPEEACALLALALFQAHLVRRAAETVLLMRYPPGAVMHGVAWLFGLSYYIVVPLSLLPPAWWQQQRWRAAAAAVASAAATASSSSSPVVSAVPAAALGAVRGALAVAWPRLGWLPLLGAAVFLLGNALQFDAHRRLAALAPPRPRRRQASSAKAQKGAAAPGDRTAYRIPRGGLFELVSCPHYLAEVVVYLGLLAATRGALLPALMLVWVAVNLVLAADATHAWYLSAFKTYPRRRRALVPFVY